MVLASIAGCSDDDPPADDSGNDGGPDSGGGESGTGGNAGGGGSNAGSGGSGSTGQAGSGTGGGGAPGGGTGGSAGQDAGADGGTGGVCGDVTCDPVATCDESGDEPTCVCPDGYDDVSGFGTRCEEEDQPECDEDDDCDADGHCIDGVCCESACDDPPACHTDEGATCEDGENCEYPELDDGEACDDDDICTDDDECNDGECEGELVVCDDDNVCTVDGCDSDADDVADRCVFDGTDITTDNCAADTLCAMDFACAGNARGDCVPAVEETCEGSGLSDECNVAVCNPDTGDCVADPVDDGTFCSDGDACTGTDGCLAGECEGADISATCVDTNPCTNDSCDPAFGCRNQANTATCDDGDPCTGTTPQPDRCAGTVCGAGGDKDCSGVENQCNASMCMPNGTCVAVPLTDMPCDDGVACTSSETCNGSGVCVDANTDSACGVGSLSCSGSPRVCTCDGPEYFFDTDSRTCQPNVCDPTPCSANATCAADGSGDPFCTCNAGYQDTNASTDPVTGVTCTNIDECAGNTQCGSNGDCAENAPGEGYSCDCDAGYQSVDASDDDVNNPLCGCDVNGSFAIRVAATLAWPEIPSPFGGGSNAAIAAGSTTTYSWAIRDHVYDADGTLHVTTTACGGTTPDICSPYFGEGYTQFLSSHIWQQAEMPVQTETMTLAASVPSSAFQTPMSAVTLGINLPAPGWDSSDTTDYGWPNSRTAVGSNGSSWGDPDADDWSGVTTYAVPGTGFPVDGNPPDPNTAFSGTSAFCSDPYAYWPTDPTVRSCGFLTPCRIARFALASRVISAYKGNFTASCGRITGDVIGPNPDSTHASDPDTDGEMRTDARIFDCRIIDSMGTLSACSSSGSAVETWLDSTPQTQQVRNASFVIKSTTDTTCAQVRARADSWWTTDP